MSKINELLGPFFLGFTAFLLMILASRLILNTRNQINIKTSRFLILEKYKTLSSNSQNLVQNRKNSAKRLLNELGSKFVKKRYKNELEKLVISSGEVDENKLNTLIEQKSFYAFSGLLITFTLVAVRNLKFLPITLALVLFGYLYPNIEILIKQLRKSKYRSKMEFMLAQSGLSDEDEFYFFIKKKLIYSFVGFSLSYIYLLLKYGNFSEFSVSVVAVFLGFFLPDVLLQNRVLKRKLELANTLPDAIDMLQMCVNAGLAFPAALTKISETQSGAISEEFARVTTEVQLGKSRQEALLSMAERTREPNIGKFVNSMAQVDRFGIPIGNVLVEQSKEMRAKRRERAKEQAQKVPVKILAPIMLCFLPTVLIVVLGPAAIMIVKTLAGN